MKLLELENIEIKNKFLSLEEWNRDSKENFDKLLARNFELQNDLLSIKEKYGLEIK
jgi:hypothetical protein